MNADVLIMGAGTAGTAAAILLSRRGLKPILIERAAKPTKKQHAADWLSQAAMEWLKQVGVDCTEQTGAAFEGITFHSSNLSKTARSSAKTPPAWRIDYPQLVNHLHQHARQAGVQIVYDAGARQIQLLEAGVRVEFEQRDTLDGKFLLLADGAARTLSGSHDNPTVLSPPSAQTTGRWFATLELPAATRGRDPRDAHMHWILGLDREQTCLLWWWEDATLVLSLLASGTGADTAALLCANAERLMDEKLIVSKQPIDPATVKLRPAPARSALEIDSHVEKRCLLIGDAGGFIGETSGEGIYPAAWSAQLAVESIAAALNSAHPQDQLRQFSTTWRSTMADYLRPPNTDVHFLLPLIFSNRQMADRMAGAFWQGSNI